MTVYIGPERRKGERRGGWTAEDHPRHRGSTDRRLGIDRRQDALAGVIAGMTAEDMQTLAAFWQGYEAERSDRARFERERMEGKYAEPDERTDADPCDD